MIFFTMDDVEYTVEFTLDRPEGDSVSFITPDGATMYISPPVRTI